ncbi:MAG: CotH kinase family protein, partial [Burkholderiales bacterium]|nr:CotH kinase family protein [Burkholderiales bacterium]
MFTRQIVLWLICGISCVFIYSISDLSARKDVVNESLPFFDINEAIKIEIEVDQDKLENLYALLPKQPVCKKIRQKYIDANSLKINGQIIHGKNRLRVRGYCHSHWLTSQKSLKVKLGQKFHNISTLNLNAWSTDPAAFDLYAGELQKANGAEAVRVRIAHLYINGEFDGARFLSENIDDDFIKSRKIEKSVIYREITHAPIGLKPNLTPYKNVLDLKNYWQKNTANNSDWSDFLRFNSAVYQSAVHGVDAWKSVINLEAYTTHEAVISILGTNHLNDHNIPMFRRLSTQKFEPIGYDYAGSYTSQYSLRLPNVSEQSLYIAQNWLSSLLWKDPETRSSIQGIVYRNLVSDLPNQILVKSKAYVREHIKGTPQAAVFESNLPFLEQLIRNRLAYLVANYLEPRFIFQNQNQLNGGGLLAQVALPFTIQQASTALPHCSGEGAVAFVAWEGQRKAYLECKNGKTFPKKVTITPKVISDRQVANQHDI